MKVLLIGCGYWGAKVFKRLSEAVGDENMGLVDSDFPKAARLAQGTNVALLAEGLGEKALRWADACVIATPIPTHYEIARQCLLAGKHVLTEKPMAKSSLRAAELVAIAKGNSRVLMTDLTFLYGTAVDQIPENKSLHLRWAGPRSERSDENILWTWGPHPVSILLRYHGGEPESSKAVISLYDDGCFATMYFQSKKGLVAGQVALEYGGDKERVAFWQGYPKSYGIGKWSEGSVNLLDEGGGDPLTTVCQSFLRKVEENDCTPDLIGFQTVRVLEMLERKAAG